MKSSSVIKGGDIIPKCKDLTGQKFERLLVVSREPSKNGHVSWLCLCDCGNYTTVRGDKLITGHTKSCGCLHKEAIHETHGKSKTRLYKTWQGMKKRCYNKTSRCYKDYGGRGIKICSEWKDDFMAFYNWSMINGYAENLEVDRIDNNKGYYPNNCRWATRKQQNRNTRQNRYFTYNGETHCLSEWCEILGLNLNTVTSRLYKQNWTISEALELKERGCIN